MAKTIPLIRAGAMFPMLIWLQAQRRPVARMLAAADLDYVTLDAPQQVIPLHNLAEFVTELARDEGPDIGCRVVSDSSLQALGFLGRVILGSASPRAALHQMIAWLPYHSSHEHMRLESIPGGLGFVEGWSVDFGPEVRHFDQQYVAALIATMCRPGDRAFQVFDRVEMAPHPETGLSHLAPWFGEHLVTAQSKALTLHISTAVLDQPSRHALGDPVPAASMSGLRNLAGFERLSDSAGLVIAAMQETGTPTVERLARASGLRLRTLQRRLADEGSSFSQLHQAVKRDLVLARIKEEAGPLAALSDHAGYARQSALTRAVRRWTGQAPSALRKSRQG